MKTCEGGLIEFAYGVVEPPGGGTIHHEVDGVACRVHLPPVGAGVDRRLLVVHAEVVVPPLLPYSVVPRDEGRGGGRRQVVHLETDPMSGRGHAVHVARGPPQDPSTLLPEGSVNQLGTGNRNEVSSVELAKCTPGADRRAYVPPLTPRKSAIPPSAK